MQKQCPAELPVPQDPLEKTRQVAETVAERAPRWASQLARLGYFSIGVVYILVAGLAVLSLFDLGGQYTGSGGAARMVLAQPYGKVLLGMIAGGLLLYVGWRLAQGLFDVEGRGWQPWGLARRAGLVLSGLSYAGLAAVAIQRLIMGFGTVDDPKDDWTVQLMQLPGGRVLVGILGAVVVAVGCYQLYAAYSAGFTDYLDDDVYGAYVGGGIRGLGRFGLASRGVVFGILGSFVVVAAWQSDPQEVHGLGEIFRLMLRQPYGKILLGVVAFGLLAFGFFMFAKARYRHVYPPEMEEEEDGEAADEGHAQERPEEGAAEMRGEAP